MVITKYRDSLHIAESSDSGQTFTKVDKWAGYGLGPKLGLWARSDILRVEIRLGLWGPLGMRRIVVRVLLFRMIYGQASLLGSKP